MIFTANESSLDLDLQLENTGENSNSVGRTLER